MHTYNLFRKLPKVLMGVASLSFIAALNLCASGSPVVEFSLQATSVTLGEPVWLTISLHNRGERSQTIDLGSNYEENVALLVTFPDGHGAEIRQPVSEGISAIGVVRLAPGESSAHVTLLNKLVDLRHTGQYTFQFSVLASHDPSYKGDQVTVEGEEAHLFVDYRNEAVLNQRCRELLERAQSGNAEEIIKGITGLAYTGDTIAIPYLKTWLDSYKGVVPVGIAFSGLARIGGDDAATILVAETESSRALRSRLARTALDQIRSTIVNPKLKEEARRAVDDAEWFRDARIEPQ